MVTAKTMGGGLGKIKQNIERRVCASREYEQGGEDRKQEERSGNTFGLLANFTLVVCSAAAGEERTSGNRKARVVA